MNNNDPLIGGNQTFQTPISIAELERHQDAINRRVEEMRRIQESVPQQQQAKTPVWDEIDSICSGLTDHEFSYLAENDEFKESSAVIQGILQREYMRIMRPIVEATRDGRDALDKHLTLIKRLRKTVKEQSEQRDALINEYINNHSDISFNDFLNIRKSERK